MANPLDLLAPLSGRSLSAMDTPEIQALMNVTGTPPFVPAPPNIGPMAPALNPSFPIPPDRPLPIPTPGEPGASSLAFPPEVPLDLNAILARAGQTANTIMGPPAPPERAPGFVQGLLQALQQGVQAGFTNDPGAALERFRQEALLRQRDKELAAREDQAERRRLTAQIYTGEVANERAERRENRREQREDERELQAYMRRQEEILGEQTFRANQAELQRIFEGKKASERAEAAAKVQAAKEEAAKRKEVLGQTNEITRDFKINRDQARRFAEYEVNGTALSAADQKAYGRIEKYRRATGAGGEGRLQAVLENGVSVPAALVDKSGGYVVINGQPINVVGYTGKGTTPAPGQPKVPNPAQQQESPARANYRAKAKAEGYSDAEITNYLNSKGIK